MDAYLETYSAILALDPANLCGWWHSGLQEGGTWNLTVNPIESRYVALRRHVMEVALRCPVQAIAYEDAGFGSPFASTKQVHNHLIGIVLLCAGELGVPAVGYKPQTIKSMAQTGAKRNKEGSIRTAKMLLQYDARDDNEADARWIGECLLRHVDPSPTKTKKRAERDFKKKHRKLF